MISLLSYILERMIKKMIKNLNQLKKVISKDIKLEIVGHCRPDYANDTRIVTLSNSQGFYSVSADPRSKINTANDGKGSVLWWSKAPFWSFENGLCSLYDSDKQKDNDHLIISFRVLEAA